MNQRIRAAVGVLLLSGTLLPYPIGLGITYLAIACAVPMVLFELLRPMPRHLHPALGLVVPLWVLLAVPAFLTTPTTTYGADKVTRLLTLTLLSALSVTLIRDRPTLLTAARMWVTVSCALSIVTLAGGFEVAGRSSAFDANPIWLARAVGAGIIFTCWMWWNGHLRRAVALFAGLIMAAGMAATGSRGPLVGCILAVGLLVILTGHNRGVRVVAAALATAFAGFALTSSAVLSSSRVGQFIADPTADTDTVRAELIQRTLPIIDQNVGGVGYGNWQSAAGSRFLQWPHNLYLEVTAEGGWVAGAALVLAVVVVAVRLFRRRQDPAAVLALALLAAEGVAVSFSGDLNARTFFAWLTLGWCVSKWSRADGAEGLPRAGGAGRGANPADRAGRGRSAVPHDLARDVRAGRRGGSAVGLGREPAGARRGRVQVPPEGAL
jgi:hypothetical protein